MWERTDLCQEKGSRVKRLKCDSVGKLFSCWQVEKFEMNQGWFLVKPLESFQNFAKFYFATRKLRSATKCARNWKKVREKLIFYLIQCNFPAGVIFSMRHFHSFTLKVQVKPPKIFSFVRNIDQNSKRVTKATSRIFLSLENENLINKLHKKYILKIKDNKKQHILKLLLLNRMKKKKMKSEKLC